MRNIFVALLLTCVVLTICGCNGDSSTNSNSGGNVVTVQIRDNFFDPKSITIAPGTTVQWVLRGSMTNHTVTENGGNFDSGLRFRSQSDQFQHTFTSTDSNKTFLYHCETHWRTDEMQGSIRVGSSAPPPPPKY